MTKQEIENNLLIALMNNKKDWALLHEEGWYRIPITTNVPIIRHGKAQHIAFYHTEIFGDLKWQIQKYARIRRIVEASRQELFPNEPENSIKAYKIYHKIEIESIQVLPKPIVSKEGRRILFIPTTFKKFINASNINQVFNTSDLEDKLIAQMEVYKVPLERQWYVQLNPRKKYWLDFAIFCQKKNINIECDGDNYHNTPEQVHYDKTRNDELVSHGWQVLRYTQKHLLEEPDWVQENLLRTIKECGGFPSRKDPAVYLAPTKKNKQQGNLFE